MSQLSKSHNFEIYKHRYEMSQVWDMSQLWDKKSQLWNTKSQLKDMSQLCGKLVPTVRYKVKHFEKKNIVTIVIYIYN